jgi:hypothetical protein
MLQGPAALPHSSRVKERNLLLNSNINVVERSRGEQNMAMLKAGCRSAEAGEEIPHKHDQVAQPLAALHFRLEHSP